MKKINRIQLAILVLIIFTGCTKSEVINYALPHNQEITLDITSDNVIKIEDLQMVGDDSLPYQVYHSTKSTISEIEFQIIYTLNLEGGIRSVAYEADYIEEDFSKLKKYLDKRYGKCQENSSTYIWELKKENRETFSMILSYDSRYIYLVIQGEQTLKEL